MPFTRADIPDQTGKLAVITGATGGLGYETALALAAAGAEVVLTGRNAKKGADALSRIRTAYPSARISYETLDLGSLKSVADFAAAFSAAHDHLNLLVNNAGVMMPQRRETTVDGFELQFGTNHLGHFALTGQLLPLLRAARAARVITVSSIAHRSAAMRFDDLQWTTGYNPTRSYGQSKLSNLLFALELQRRSDSQGWGIKSIAAHPGVSSTELVANGIGTGFIGSIASTMIRFFGHPPAPGALPQILAATSPDAKPAGYYGPTGFFEIAGPPGTAQIMPQAADPAAAARLWTISERLTGVSYPKLAEAA
jgi:NAD(P)-dependent dehydrogenase (short-subunit alcohol dehydrogenase family)